MKLKVKETCFGFFGVTTLHEKDSIIEVEEGATFPSKYFELVESAKPVHEEHTEKQVKKTKKH